jgi:hypothetical protein
VSEDWRYREDNGPEFVRISRSVRYPFDEVERFEKDNFCTIVQNRSDRRAA